MLAGVLEDVARGKVRRLIVEMPPRHGKSELVSRHFPAWYLGMHPDRWIMHVSYGWDLVRGFSRENQLDVRSPEYARFFPDVKLDRHMRSLYRWGFEGWSGGYIATGMGGALTGQGANGLIIDDPIRSRADVESRTFREQQWDWFWSTAYTRVEPQGFVVVVLTRWHQDDLAGRLLRQGRDGGEKWKVLRLPAMAESEDLLGREAGQPLWPERWPIEALEEIKKNQPDYEWQAQYQQHPTPPGGSIFLHEWWRTYDPSIPLNLVAVVSSWDTATKDGEENDYNAVWTAGLGYDGNIYVIDVQKFKATAADLIGTERSPGLIARYYGWMRDNGLTITSMPIEDKGSGSVAIQMLASMQPHLPIVPVPRPPGNGKRDRARAAAVHYRERRVLHRATAPWRSWFEPLCEDFPGGQYDDPVDAMSQGLVYVSMPPQQYIEVLEPPRVYLGRY